MIKFVKNFRQYAIGEVAGFSKDHETWLIQKKVAERFMPPKEEAVAKSAGTEKKDNPTPPVTRQTTVGPQTRK
jgi:hypothetical protein